MRVEIKISPFLFFWRAKPFFTTSLFFKCHALPGGVTPSTLGLNVGMCYPCPQTMCYLCPRTGVTHVLKQCVTHVLKQCVTHVPTQCVTYVLKQVLPCSHFLIVASPSIHDPKWEH